MRNKKPRAVVGPARRLDDGSAICRVRIPFDHPTEAVTLIDADGHAFQVDYDITYRAGPGPTVVRRQDGNGKWTGRITRELRPVRDVAQVVLTARPDTLQRTLAAAWRQREERSQHDQRTAPATLATTEEKHRPRLFD